MTDLDELIQFWQAFLDFREDVITSNVAHRVRETLKALKELKKFKGE